MVQSARSMSIDRSVELL